MRTSTKVLVVVAVGSFQVLTLLALYQQGHALGRLDGYADGYADGYKAALNTSEPSDELEIACAGLWFGEQTKKQLERGR
jgi:hypothetical protein